ncbi:unnamed protein product [Brassica oleracea var. botrytis]
MWILPMLYIVLQFYQRHGGDKRHDPRHLVFVDGEVPAIVVRGLPFFGNDHTVVGHGGCLQQISEIFI